MSGQNAFMPFIKVPAMTKNKDKIADLIAFEAQQKIPYPIEDVAWDYQLIESEDAVSHEIDAMLVSVKTEEIDKITVPLVKMGKTVRIIEVAPTASFNAAKANGVGENQCEMFLNMGGKSSTLIFLDGNRFYVRPFPLAGNTITQAIMKEFGVGAVEAEEMKRRYAYVPMGVDSPEGGTAETVAKIVRNVMGRLYNEIVRSINIYRSTQGGNMPQKMYLAGGTSIIPYTQSFFAEKMKIPVEYFNPFQVVAVSESLDQEKLSSIAHLFSEEIGLALRKIGTCPIEIALVPEAVKKQNAFKAKYPYFYTAAGFLLVYLGLSYWAFDTQLTEINGKRDVFQNYVNKKQGVVKTVEEAQAQLGSEERKLKQANELLGLRNNWINLLNILQEAAPSNMWFTKIFVSEDATVALSMSESSERNTGSSGGGLFAMMAANKGKGGSGDPDDMPMMMRPSSKQSGMQQMVREKIWLNLQGHVVNTTKGINNSEVGLNAINALLDSLIQEDSIFVFSQKDNPRYVFHESTDPDTNITSFELSLEMNAPINVESKKKKR